MYHSDVMHPLQLPAIVASVERAASAHLGRGWTATAFTDLDDRASHPAGVFHGRSFSVFAKLDREAEQFRAELRGLEYLRTQAPVATPRPVAAGVVAVDGGVLLLLEAVTEVPATPDRWRSVGHSLAALHQVRGSRYGLDFDGYFGPVRQDNRPVASNRWCDFYAERRLLPCLRVAVDSGHLPPELAAGVSRVAARLPDRCGPEPTPALLHGDAQRNNILITPTGPVLIDVSPYFGHPEIDLALLDYFAPVPDAVYDAYREVAPIDPGFAERRELWRLFGYLAVIAVSGLSAFGRPYLTRIAEVVARYR